MLADHWREVGVGVSDDGDVSGLSTGCATGRIEVIARMTRRRHWTTSEKREILDAAFGPGGSPGGAARRVEVTTGLLYTWRRLHRSGELGVGEADKPPGFARVELAAAPPLLPGPSERADSGAASSGVIAVEMPSGARLRIEGAVDGNALARVLRALAR